MSEVIISQWKEPVYIEEVDILKGKKGLGTLSAIVFCFFPEIHFSNHGIYNRNVVKILDTKTGKTRIIKEEIK